MSLILESTLFTCYSNNFGLSLMFLWVSLCLVDVSGFSVSVVNCSSLNLLTIFYHSSYFFLLYSLLICFLVLQWYLFSRQEALIYYILQFWSFFSYVICFSLTNFRHLFEHNRIPSSLIFSNPDFSTNSTSFVTVLDYTSIQSDFSWVFYSLTPQSDALLHFQFHLLFLIMFSCLIFTQEPSADLALRRHIL